MENEILQQILIELKELRQGQTKLEQGQTKLEKKVEKIERDITQIKEDTTITREATNKLVEWVDEASGIVEVRFPIKKNKI